MIEKTVSFKDWKNQRAKTTAVANGIKQIFGRNLFKQQGITIMRKPCNSIEINNNDHQKTLKVSCESVPGINN